MILHNSKTEPMVETITTSDRVQHTVVKTTRKNAQGMISDERSREIAPTPRRATQVITTEMVHHSMKRKRNTRQLPRLLRSTQHQIKLSNT
jgi:hypothetical protein